MNIFTSLEKQIGITDEVDTCFCCGKTKLKRTVVFETTSEWQGEGGDQFVFFGTTCATNAKGKAKKQFTDIQSKVNAEGLTASEQRDKADREKVKVNYAKFLVNRGHSLPEAWDIIRHIESTDNGIYRMATKLKLVKEGAANA